jgi:hypothetical protein
MDRRQWEREKERAAAACVAAAVDGMSLHEMREAPDADLVHVDGYHVGLEIVRTEDPRPLHLRQRMEACSKLLFGALQAAGLKGVFRPYYDVASMSESMERPQKRAWDRDVPGRLVGVVAARGAVALESALLAAHGISCVAHIEVESADRLFVGVGWQLSTKRGETLAELALANKHVKLAAYRRDNGDQFREYWLAISGLGPGVMEDGGFSMLLERRFKTDFDRVFLLWFGGGTGYARAEDITPT